MNPYYIQNWEQGLIDDGVGQDGIDEYMATHQQEWMYYDKYQAELEAQKKDNPHDDMEDLRTNEDRYNEEKHKQELLQHDLNNLIANDPNNPLIPTLQYLNQTYLQNMHEYETHAGAGLDQRTHAEGEGGKLVQAEARDEAQMAQNAAVFDALDAQGQIDVLNAEIAHMPQGKDPAILIAERDALQQQIDDNAIEGSAENAARVADNRTGAGATGMVGDIPSSTTLVAHQVNDTYTLALEQHHHTIEELFGTMARAYGDLRYEGERDVEAEAVVKGNAGGAGAATGQRFGTSATPGDLFRATMQTLIEQRLQAVR